MADENFFMFDQSNMNEGACFFADVSGAMVH
jgi:hypothetical protein